MKNAKNISTFIAIDWALYLLFRQLEKKPPNQTNIKMHDIAREMVLRGLF